MDSNIISILALIVIVLFVISIMAMFLSFLCVMEKGWPQGFTIKIIKEKEND